MDELKIAELEIPTEKSNEVLAENCYATINPKDYKNPKVELKIFMNNKLLKDFLEQKMQESLSKWQMR